ncbi:MAG: hypothetical protein Q8O41_09220 [Candidatus Methanoperedens sp.]|nr:hypothetical protein [Candidatus Methanoperedens sp.]
MGYLDEPKNINILRKLFYLSLIVVVILEFIMIRREHIELSPEHIAEFPAFHAWYGFIACVLIILVSKFIGYLLLMKEEDYYD